MSLLLLFPSGVVQVTDADTGTGADTAQLGLAGADAGTSIDVVVVGGLGADTATGLDTAALSVAVTDAASGVEGALLDLVGADTATSLDTTTIQVVLADADTAVAVDDAVVLASVVVTDQMASVDATVLTAAVLASDGVLAVDTESTTAQLTVGDTAVAGDVNDLHVTAPTTDVVTAVDAALLAAQLVDADGGQAQDSVVLVAMLTDGDTATGVDAESLTARQAVSATDVASGVDTADVVAQVSASDAGQAIDAGRVLAQLDATDASGAADVASLAVLASTDTALIVDVALVAVASSDAGVATERELATVSVAQNDAAVAAEDATVQTIQPISADDVAVVSDTAVPSLPPPPRSVFEIESPSVVEILRSVTTRINGSARVQWLPLSQLVGGELFGLSPRRPVGEPVLGGQLAVRFDLHFVRPGAAQPAPPVAGVMPDRVGVLFADVSAVGQLKAGDRVRCVSGPIDGTFEIRVIPDVAVGYTVGHHVEVEVVEVSQKGGGSYFDPSLDATAFPSFMRPLYDTRVQVLRRVVTSEGAGSARESWPVITDVPDLTWGVPGELWCRLSLRFLRRGKDQPPPLVAGRAPDRIGVLYCDVTPHLLAGDRVRCVEGPTAGTFELRAAPDLSPDLLTIHHLEVQVVEVAQALVGAYPRAGGG